MARRSAMTALGALALAGMAAVGITTAAAQEDRMYRPEAIIYRDAGYSGPAVNVSQPQPNMGLAWRVNSIRVRAGRWQLCEQTNYRGNCVTFDRDRSVIGVNGRGITVQSMRPMDYGAGGSLEPGRNPNLRGMAAQFYAAPARNGYRVLACPNGNATSSCAERSANDFCASMGWRRSARQAMETVSRRVYLADVLCSNTGY